MARNQMCQTHYYNIQAKYLSDISSSVIEINSFALIPVSKSKAMIARLRKERYLLVFHTLSILLTSASLK